VAIPVAAKTQPGKSHRIIQKLHPLLAAGALARQFSLFTCSHAVNPEPAQHEKKYNQKQFH
jgi:hypothetical protein